jgi:hypothetical protein
MGLESPNDANPEITGVIGNRVAGRPILDVYVWFEDLQGNKLKTGNGACPFSALSSGAGSSLTPATLVSNAGGVSVFNLAQGIPQSSSGGHNYEAQIDQFNEPNNYKVKMAFSTTKAGDSKHFLSLGEFAFDSDGDQHIMDGIAPSIREGVMLVAENAGEDNLIGFTITLASNDEALVFTGGAIRTATDPDEAISGVDVQLSGNALTIYLTDLQVAGGERVAVWLDLNKGYTVTTTFTVSAQY